MTVRPTDLVLALSAADAADEIAMARFQAADLAIETKPDRTFVTDADRAVLDLARRIDHQHEAAALVGADGLIGHQQHGLSEPNDMGLSGRTVAVS